MWKLLWAVLTLSDTGAVAVSTLAVEFADHAACEATAAALSQTAVKPFEGHQAQVTGSAKCVADTPGEAAVETPGPGPALSVQPRPGPPGSLLPVPMRPVPARPGWAAEPPPRWAGGPPPWNLAHRYQGSDPRPAFPFQFGH